MLGLDIQDNFSFTADAVGGGVTSVSTKRRSYTPWIIGAGVIVVALIGAIVIAVTQRRR